MYILKEKEKKKNLYNRSFWHNQLIQRYSCAGISLLLKQFAVVQNVFFLLMNSFTMDFDRNRREDTVREVESVCTAILGDDTSGNKTFPFTNLTPFQIH